MQAWGGAVNTFREGIVKQRTEISAIWLTVGIFTYCQEKKYMIGIHIEKSQTEFRAVNLPCGLSILTLLFILPFLCSRTQSSFHLLELLS